MTSPFASLISRFCLVAALAGAISIVGLLDTEAAHVLARNGAVVPDNIVVDHPAIKNIMMPLSLKLFRQDQFSVEAQCYVFNADGTPPPVTMGGMWFGRRFPKGALGFDLEKLRADENTGTDEIVWRMVTYALARSNDDPAAAALLVNRAEQRDAGCLTKESQAARSEIALIKAGLISELDTEGVAFARKLHRAEFSDLPEHMALRRQLLKISEQDAMAFSRMYREAYARISQHEAGTRRPISSSPQGPASTPAPSPPMPRGNTPARTAVTDKLPTEPSNIDAAASSLRDSLEALARLCLQVASPQRC